MSIRLKVILPYLFLTLLVAVIGVYVVTRLFSTRLSERLTNQLLDSGRAVSDSFVRQELEHVDDARIIAYTTGLPEALLNADREAALAISIPVTSGLSIENLILITPNGRELVHLIVDEDGKLITVHEYTGVEQSSIVQPYLLNKDPQEPPHRALGLNQVDEKYYYYTAIPVPYENGFAGVVVVGTSVDTILPNLKSTVIADVLLYGGNGDMLGSTLVPGQLSEESNETLTLTADEFNAMILSDDLTTGEDFSVDGRWYRLARGPLQVGDDRIGIFAVALPLNFVIESTIDSRTNYVILFTFVMVIVIAIGFLVTRLIINPLSKLVQTSQVIAGGKLDERTGIRSRDEIGRLAVSFDTMTDSLQERTLELEKTNDMLKKMDRVKGNFIQISAHELRTPLTLIMGYAQMLELQSKGNAEILKSAKGILDGSERMIDIVNNMLDVSRIDNKTLYLKKSPLRVGDVISSVQRTFSADLKTRNIDLTIDGLKELPIIPADPEMIQKVFYHMIMNSIKYTPDGGSVFVSGQYKNGVEAPHVEITIRDTGIGIDPATIPMLFSKFYQTGDVMLHSSGKTKFKGGGLGLGLVIANGIVEAHGGNIRVESPGYDEENFPGSTFYVSLPVEKNNEVG